MQIVREPDLNQVQASVVVIHRIALSTILVTAAVLKLRSLMIRTGAPENAFVLATYIFIAGEMFAAFWLLLTSGGKLIWAAMLALWSLFSCVVFVKVLRGEQSCGCFGDREIAPAVTLLFDLGVVASLFVLRKKWLNVVFVSVRRRLVFCIVMAIYISMLVLPLKMLQGGSQGSEYGSVLSDGSILINSNNLVGKKFSISKVIDGGGSLERGRWKVVFFRFQCEHCVQLISRMMVENRDELEAGSVRIMFVEVPPFTVQQQGKLSINPPFVLARLSDKLDWFIVTPLVLELQAGYVERATSIP